MVASRNWRTTAFRHERSEPSPVGRGVRVRQGWRLLTFEVFTRGFHELEAAFEDVKANVDPVLGKALTAATGPVKDDVKRRASGYGERTVSGVRIRRRGTMVRVEQGARKTTGLRPSYGAFQQRRFFDPALADNEGQAISDAREAMDALVARASFFGLRAAP